MVSLAEEKQIFKMPDGSLQIELPAPSFFVVKTNRQFSDRELGEIDKFNEEVRIEINADGDFEIMPRSFLEASRRKMEMLGQLGVWAKKDGRGVGFESSAKFALPNGAKRMPDVSWMLKERYYALSAEELFASICPDFVIELRSKSDNLQKLQNKMREYIENGARLGWLIDPYEKRVHVYRADKTVEVFNKPTTVSGEDVLQGFELNLTEIW